MTKKTTHTDIADNVDDKTTAFNALLQDFDSMLADVLDIDVGATNLATVTDKDFYSNAVFRIDDAAGATGNIQITVPSTSRAGFVVINNTAQKVFIIIEGQVASRFTPTLTSAHYFFDNIGEVATTYGTAGIFDDVLSDTVASAIFDIDVTIVSSYPGTGLDIANLEGDPDYDFIFGDGSDTDKNPTFVGTGGDSGAYLEFSASTFPNDLLSLATGQNTTLLADLHKTSGSDFWFSIAGRMKAGSNNWWLSTAPSGSHAGLGIQLADSEQFKLHQYGVAATDTLSPEILHTDFEFCLVISHDRGTNTTRMWLNGIEQGGSHTFSATTGDSLQDNLIIGAISLLGSLGIDTGSRVYAVGFGDAFIADADEANIRNLYETRHARSYTRDQTTLADEVTGIGVVAEWNAAKFDSAYATASHMENIIASPADGGATADYHLPDISLPPLLSGFGPASLPSYWNPATGDYWQIASNTTFLDDMHKTTGGTDWCFIAVIESDGSLANDAPLAATNPGAGAGNDGFRIETTAIEAMNLAQDGTAASGTDVPWRGPALRSGTHFLAIAYDTSLDDYTLWWNTGTGVTKSAGFAASIVAASGLFTLGAESDGGIIHGANLNWYMSFLLNVVPTDAKMAEIITYCEGIGSQSGLANLDTMANTAQKFYIMSDSLNDVFLFHGTTVDDISTLEFRDRLGFVQNEDLSPKASWIDPTNGLKMYIAGDFGNAIDEYDLEIAYDPSSLVFVQTISIGTWETAIRGIELNPTGTKVFISGNTEEVHEFALSPAWDISSLSFTTQYTGHPGTNLQGMRFADSGNKLYTVDAVSSLIYQHNLTGAYDLTTASYSTNSLDVSTQEAQPTGCDLNFDGTLLWAVGVADEIFEYKQTAGYDLSTGSYNSISFDVGPTTISSEDIQVI